MLVSALPLVQEPVLTQSKQKPLGIFLGGGAGVIGTPVCTVLLQPLSLQMISNRIIQELIGSLIATFQRALVDLDVVVNVFALLDLPVKQGS